jgi:hypothetical protein
MGSSTEKSGWQPTMKDKVVSIDILVYICSLGVKMGHQKSNIKHPQGESGTLQLGLWCTVLKNEATAGKSARCVQEVEQVMNEAPKQYT